MKRIKQIKVLLFDLDPASEAGDTLRQLLESNSGASFDLNYKLINEAEMPKAARHLASTLRRFSPDLAFCIFASASRPLIPDLFAVFRANKTGQPIVAVVNSGQPQEVSEVLYHGANDFLIPPFRPIDVLPRVWRWIEEVRQEDASIRVLKDKLGLAKFIEDSTAFLDEINRIKGPARLTSGSSRRQTWIWKRPCVPDGCGHSRSVSH